MFYGLSALAKLVRQIQLACHVTSALLMSETSHKTKTLGIRVRLRFRFHCSSPQLFFSTCVMVQVIIFEYILFKRGV